MKFKLSGEYSELLPVRNWEAHNGIDLAMPEGTKLRAIHEGIIDKVFDGSDNIGRGLSIKFDDGSRAIYGHMNNVNVKVGDHVNSGDVIGLSGNTGNSTGPHLHFGMKDPSGNFVDPTPLSDQISNMSGDHVQYGIIPKLFGNHDTQGPLTRMLWGSTEGLRIKADEITTQIIFGIGDALKHILVDFTLIGAGIMIILAVGGWKSGNKWAGVLITANILIRYLFGGGGM